jgi:hypothetical protein
LRKLFIGALVGALALAVAAIAFGATTQTYSQTFSKSNAGASTGTSFKTSSSDPANPKNQQPKAVREFDIKFPAGSKVNYKAVPVCNASDDDILTNPPGSPQAACKKSVIGSGKASARLPFAVPDIQATVTAFNAKKALILYVQPQGSNSFVLRPKFKGNVNNGPTLATKVPPNCIPPSTNQGGFCRNAPGGPVQDEAILNHFELKTLANKKGKNVLMTTPKKCKGTWTFTANLTYADGTKVSVQSKQPCKK